MNTIHKMNTLDSSVSENICKYLRHKDLYNLSIVNAKYSKDVDFYIKYNIRNVKIWSRNLYFSTLFVMSKKIIFLESLELNWCPNIFERNNGITLYHFSSLKRLKIDNLTRYDINSIISLLESSPQLKTLIFIWISFTEKDIYKIAGYFQKLDELHLDYMQITDLTLINISSYLNNLEKINIIGCLKIGDKGIIELFKKCNRLKSIRLELDITDEAIYKMANKCYLLEELNLTLCNDEITSVSLNYLLEKCKLLKSIKIKGFFTTFDEYKDSVTNDIFYGILKSTSLNKIYFENCSGINDMGINILAESKLFIESFFFRNCINISNQSIQILVKNSKFLKWYEINRKIYEM